MQLRHVQPRRGSISRLTWITVQRWVHRAGEPRESEAPSLQTIWVCRGAAVDAAAAGSFVADLCIVQGVN
jgi:hypothetical protein